LPPPLLRTILKRTKIKNQLTKWSLVVAKKKKAKINLFISDTKVTTLPVVNKDGLPSYKHYADTPHHKTRVFFEEPHSADDVTDIEYPNKVYLRAGKYSRGIKSCFMIFRDGRYLVGEDIARTFSRLFIKRMSESELTKSTLGNQHSAIKSFFSFLSLLKSPPTLYSQLSIVHFSSWLDSFDKAKTAHNNKSHLIQLLNRHSFTKELNLNSIKIKDKIKPKGSITQVDFDKIVGEHDYSDKELMQILAYTFYEIEQAKDRFENFKNVTKENLSNEYIALTDLNVKNPKIPLLLEQGVQGYQVLLKSIVLHLKNEVNGIRKNPSTSDNQFFMQRLKTVSSLIYKEHNYFNDFFDFLLSQSWSMSKDKVGKTNYFKHLSLSSDHHELAILVYTLITTGLNLETIMSWKFQINSKYWYENFDVELGINDKTITRDKSILLTGIKQKGKGIAKTISTPIKVNSPLYNYLKFLDKTRPNDRKYIFTLKDIHRKLNSFVKHYGVISDDGTNLKSLETKRLRKVFAGHKLMSLLKDVKNADELVAKLKDALNHNKFDTTLFSYILKSGVGNLLINSAIVALTSDLIEKAITFRGEIKEDFERSDNTHKVFLCDCSDPSNPSHNLPISDRCHKYDMCLGCERSEVYSEHLPAICYRIMQYEAKQNNDPEVFKITLEDRLLVARDTLERFKIKHINGVRLLEDAYIEANDAFTNNIPLLPPILQVGGIG